MDIQSKNICHECVEEAVLNTQIRKEGKRGKCAYCKKSRKVKKLQWLAESIHQAIGQHFRLTPNEPSAFEYAVLRDKESNYDWERRGESVNDIIQEIAEVDEPIANDAQQYLMDVYGLDPMEYVDENPFEDEAQYEESGPDDQRFQESWNYFRRELESHARFFSRSAEEVLEELFSDVGTLETLEGDFVVRAIGPESKDRFLYRARVSQTNLTMEQILKDPVNQLGAPDSTMAKSGRMNAFGISVFYGASQPETCIAEIRPPVGSHVLLGRFEIIRDVRLLDFDLLTKVYVNGSFFDPEFAAQLGRAAFLRNLTGELIKPVMPGDEPFEYLPTQVIAEFLSEKIEPPIDGVIFKSSQTETGENIVLFNRSSKTQPYKLSQGTKISVDFGWASEDGYDDSITVFEEQPKNSTKSSVKKEERKQPNPFIDDFCFDFDDAAMNDENFDDRQDTLRLDVNSIKVKVIKEVAFKTENRSVMRHRSDAVDDTNPDF